MIPIYNAEATIERCLESIYAQQVPFPFEVLIADSSTDRTPEIIAERFPHARYHRIERRAYPGAARNVAIPHARAPLVMMLDADCIAEPGLLAGMVAAHESGEYAAIGGAIRNGTPRSASGLIGYLLEFREFIPQAPRRSVHTVPTANVCYRKDLFDKYGLFADVRASEDLLFNWSISLAGEQILFEPTLRVTHLNKTGWLNVIRYQRVLGKNSALARHRMNPPFEVIRAYPALGWLMPYLIRYPWLGVSIPPVRLARAIVWLLRYDPKSCLMLMLLSPGYMAAALVWALAFVQGLREIRGGPRQTDGPRRSEPASAGDSM